MPMSLAVHTLTLGPVQTNTYLVADPHSGVCAVIDPAWEGERIVAAARSRGWRIAHIWLTHAHFDHIGGAGAVSDAYNPPLPVALHPEDYPLWRHRGGAALFGLHIDPGPEPTIDLFHGQIVRLGELKFEVRHVPGHTRGHVLFYCPQAGAAFVGDVVFQGSIGRTDLPGGDYDTLLESIRTQVLSLPDETRLYPGHGPATTVGQERQGNPFLM